MQLFLLKVHMIIDNILKRQEHIIFQESKNETRLVELFNKAEYNIKTNTIR